jgi:hypothetical protein
MRCQDVERLMVDSSEREMTREEKRLLSNHLESCPDCTAFRAFRAGLRSSWTDVPAPDLEGDLVEKVRRRCHDELRIMSPLHSAVVPLSIWVAFGVLTVITLGFFIPQVLDLFATKEFTPALGFTLVILLQNAVMLFFAPVIMRHGRVGHGNWKECR